MLDFCNPIRIRVHWNIRSGSWAVTINNIVDQDEEVDEDDDGEEKDVEYEDAEVAKFVRELENQAFSCSDCGVKTPSR